MSTASILERFTIRGVHGYKDLSIDFAGPATIIAAENGTGKTTIFNALNAFLTRRFHRLAALPFRTIECKFENHDSLIVLDKETISGSDFSAEPEYREMMTGSGLTNEEFNDFMTAYYQPGNLSILRTHPTGRQLYETTPYDYTTLDGHLSQISLKMGSSLSDSARAVSAQVRELVGDCEVVYLPTYRRIERPLLRRPQSRALRSASPRNRQEGRDISHDDMAFGLADVEQRLIEISEDIERRSNLEYRSLSARIIEEMLKGKATRESLTQEDLPDLESLARFLSRVGRTETQHDAVFQDINNLYSTGAINEPDNWFLRYFLTRLGRVVGQTKVMELNVERFVRVCNSYLETSADSKQLSFDPQTLKVIVRDLWAKVPILLDDLSSGEKQIVSLMARLYLSGKAKIVLIDEPELSLSIDWQRKVLPDVLKSGTVIQLLAITHSPFIFENDLDGTARPLEIRRTGAQR